MKRFSSPRQRWAVLAGLWVVLMILGFGGFAQQSRTAGLGRSVLDNLYLTMQLATLDYKAGDAAINWRLQIARFTAPVIAAGTLLQTASVVFREQFERWRLRRLGGHTVVLGLGPVGVRLAKALAGAGRSVVAVGAAGSPELAGLHAAGIATVEGDPSDASVLALARVPHAAAVVVAAAEDASNVSVAVALRQMERPQGLAPLRCAVHLDQLDITELLSPTSLGGQGAVRMEFFNLHAQGGRALLDEYAAQLDGEQPHLAVVGFGRFGTSVAVAAAQRAAGAMSLTLTVVDPVAGGRWHALRRRHPGLDDVVDARCLDIDLANPSASATQQFLDALQDPPASLIVIATDDESAALATGLFVHHALRRRDLPVVVRTRSDSGLAGVLVPEDGAQPFPGLTIFPLYDRACTVAVLDGGMREQIARGIHLAHVGDGGAPAPVAGAGSALHRPWEQLSDAERDSSRQAVDGIVGGFALIGFQLVPLARWGAPAPELTDAELEAMAEAEHDRWRLERTAAGWQYGDVRDDAGKRNPLLVEWNQLPDDVRQRNRAAISQIPEQLARAGVALVRS